MNKTKKEKQFFKIGKVLGDFIVVEEPSRNEVRVKCVCRKTLKVIEVDVEQLKAINSHKKKSNASRKVNMPEVGKKINNLTVISSEIQRGKFGEMLILVRCDCGNEKYIRNQYFLKGNTTSCGCVQKARAKEARITHGLYKSKEYKTWQRLKTICFNENNASYQQHGATGIEMYPQWVNCFQSFYDDMGPCPQDGIITRIDPSKGFFPNNCRWVTKEEFKKINSLIRCGINPRILIQDKTNKLVTTAKNDISRSTIAAIRKEHAKGESNISILSQKYGILPNEIVNILIYGYTNKSI